MLRRLLTVLTTTALALAFALSGLCVVGGATGLGLLLGLLLGRRREAVADRGLGATVPDAAPLR